MPLSEREQRILDEIEKGLYHEDPSFARDVTRRSPHYEERRRARIGVFVFVLGFALLIIFFASGLVLVGVGAFGAMVAGIVMLSSALRGVIDPRSSRPPHTSVSRRVGEAARRWEERVRQRYKRP